MHGNFIVAYRICLVKLNLHKPRLKEFGICVLRPGLAKCHLSILAWHSMDFGVRGLTSYSGDHGNVLQSILHSIQEYCMNNSASS